MTKEEYTAQCIRCDNFNNVQRDIDKIATLRTGFKGVQIVAMLGPSFESVGSPCPSANIAEVVDIRKHSRMLAEYIKNELETEECRLLQLQANI